MKVLTISLLALCAVFAGAQEPEGMDMKPPAEMAMTDFMLGDWKGKAVMRFGGPPMESAVTMSTQRSLNGRYQQSLHSYAVAGVPEGIEGMHMLTYDPDKKVFLAYWFDGAAPNMMQMAGNFDNGRLVMLSTPTEMPGLGTMEFRASWERKSEKELIFTLEAKQGEKWEPMIESTYSKA